MFEGMIRSVFQKRHGRRAAEPFPVMTYAEAMRRYGSDKPDLRVTLRVHRADRRDEGRRVQGVHRRRPTCKDGRVVGAARARRRRA